MDKSQQVKKIKTALKKSIGSINKMLSLLDEEMPECSDVLIQLDSALDPCSRLEIKLWTLFWMLVCEKISSLEISKN